MRYTRHPGKEKLQWSYEIRAANFFSEISGLNLPRFRENGLLPLPPASHAQQRGVGQHLLEGGLQPLAIVRRINERNQRTHRHSARNQVRSQRHFQFEGGKETLRHLTITAVTCPTKAGDSLGRGEGGLIVVTYGRIAEIRTTQCPKQWPANRHSAKRCGEDERYVIPRTGRRPHHEATDRSIATARYPQPRARRDGVVSQNYTLFAGAPTARLRAIKFSASGEPCVLSVETTNRRCGRACGPAVRISRTIPFAPTRASLACTARVHRTMDARRHSPSGGA